jgi:hypothetical protein
LGADLVEADFFGDFAAEFDGLGLGNGGFGLGGGGLGLRSGFIGVLIVKYNFDIGVLEVVGDGVGGVFGF